MPLITTSVRYSLYRLKKKKRKTTYLWFISVDTSKDIKPGVSLCVVSLLRMWPVLESKAALASERTELSPASLYIKSNI